MGKRDSFATSARMAFKIFFLDCFRFMFFRKTRYAALKKIADFNDSSSLEWDYEEALLIAGGLFPSLRCKMPLRTPDRRYYKKGN